MTLYPFKPYPESHDYVMRSACTARLVLTQLEKQSLYTCLQSIRCVVQVAAALVLCTVASAPLMFLSAMMYGMQIFSMDVDRVITETKQDTSIVSIVSCVSSVKSLSYCFQYLQNKHILFRILWCWSGSDEAVLIISHVYSTCDILYPYIHAHTCLI